VTLPSLSLLQGNHTFLSFTSDPNGLPDDYDLNDSSNVEFKYLTAQPFILRDSVINETCYNSNDGFISVIPIPKTEIIEDWEGNTDWNIINGSQINQWHIGNSIAYEGNQSIYISDNNNTNTYTTNSSSIVHFHKDFYFPADATNITINFVYKGYGQMGQDYLKVFLVPTSVLPAAGYDLSLHLSNI
jgi:hypothetical protein